MSAGKTSSLILTTFPDNDPNWLNGNASILTSAFIPSFTNFVAIDCLKDSKFAKKVLENLINNGVFVRMPYSYPQNRCIRVTVGLDKDIDLFEKYFPIALKES